MEAQSNSDFTARAISNIPPYKEGSQIAKVFKSMKFKLDEDFFLIFLHKV